jgi:hypothetical protein
VGKVVLGLAALIDFALAALLVAASGFIVGSGPESMHAGRWFAAAYVAAILACIAAPVAGFILNARGKTPLGFALVFMPPAGALMALLIPPPY